MFGPVVKALGEWGYKWSTRDLRDEHLDPDYPRRDARSRV